MNIGDLFLQLLADGSKLEQSVNQAALKAGDAGGKTLGSRLSSGASRAMTVAGGAIGTFVAAGVEQFGAFQQKMNEVFTLLPGITDDAMGQMTADVKAFSRETGRSTDEVIPALYQAISAGVPPENVFDFLRVANKGATAGVASTAEEVSLLTAVTKGFGDTSQEAVTQAADLAQLQVKLGQTTIPELAASYGKAVPLASALGVSQEELAASSASLFGVTGNTAEVMTQLKAVFTALITQNPKLTAGLKEMGFATSEQAIESLGLQGTLEGLEEATGGSTQELQAMLGSSEAVTAALALTGAQADTFTSNLGAMEDSAGTVDAAFERMDSGIAASARKIAATIGTLAIDVGEKFQSIGPLLLALNQGGQLFGVSPARLFGGIAGAITGRVVTPLIRGLTGVFQDVSLGRKLGGALFGGGGMLEGISSGLAKIPGASGVKAGLGKVGGLMGTTIGKAMGLAAGAAFVLWMLNEIERRRAEAAEKVASIGEGVSQQIASGTTAELEQSLAGLKQGIDAIVAETNRNGVITLATPEQITALEGLVAQYNAVQTELNRRAVESARVPEAALRAAQPGTQQAAQALGDSIPTGLQKSQAQIAAQAAIAARTIGDKLVAAGPEVRRSAAGVMLEAAAGIRSRRDAIRGALDQLKADMKNRLSPMAQTGQLIGQLFSRRLAKALNDSDPLIEKQAKGTRALIEAELIETIRSGGEAGKKIQDELEQKLKSKDPQVRRQAERTKSIIDAALKDQPPTTPGEAIARALNSDLGNSSTVLGRTAYNIGRTIARNLLAGVQGTGVVGGGGLTQQQQTNIDRANREGFAEGTGYVPFDQIAAIHRGEIVVPEPLATAVRAGDAVLSGGSLAAADGAPSVTLVMPDARNRDPFEVLERARRMVGFGLFSSPTAATEAPER